MLLVDIHVADAIMKHVIKEQLIGKRKTVLMVTSHYKYLK